MCLDFRVRRDWMKRLSATFAGGILLRKIAAIDRDMKENSYGLHRLRSG